MVDGRSTNDSDNEDYSKMSDATGSKIGGRLRSWKQVRQSKDTRDDDEAACPSHCLDFLCQAIVATSSDGMQESEEIPIYRYFTLKTIGLKVVYCLIFSQELLLRPQV